MLHVNFLLVWRAIIRFERAKTMKRIIVEIITHCQPHCLGPLYFTCMPNIIISPARETSKLYHHVGTFIIKKAPTWNNDLSLFGSLYCVFNATSEIMTSMTLILFWCHLDPKICYYMLKYNFSLWILLNKTQNQHKVRLMIKKYFMSGEQRDDVSMYYYIT